MKDPLVFVAAKRCPFGTFNGTLASLSATDLAVETSKAMLEDAQINPARIDHVIIGNVVQSSKDAIYLARHVGLRIGVPIDKPALTVNRLCGSGFEAIVQGAYALGMTRAKTVLVGGTESMSQVPFVLRGARTGYRMGHVELEDLLMASLTDSYVNLPMALTAENLAVKYEISRSDADEYALQSQQRAQKAWESGALAEEVVPIPVKKKKEILHFSKDEHMKPETNMEALNKLTPVFKKDGVVTAGNASGITDGAAMLVLTTESNAKDNGWKVLGYLRAYSFVGCAPEIMGIGPVPAIKEVFKSYYDLNGKSLTINDMQRIEVNEAFAAQYLAVEKELKLPREKTNSCGGAIAIGHPLAASGARLVTHLLFDLKRKGGGFGVASACIGGGQGMAVLIEVCS